MGVRERPKLHVQLHGLFELFLAIHGLPDVIDEPALEDLPVQVLVPQLQGLALLLEVGPDKSVVVGAGDAGALRQLVILQRVDDVGLHAELAHDGRYRVPEVVRRNRRPDSTADTRCWDARALKAGAVLSSRA